ncbi:hypothetical protein [[Eubacterium] cellulosolvens]
MHISSTRPRNELLLTPTPRDKKIGIISTSKIQNILNCIDYQIEYLSLRDIKDDKDLAQISEFLTDKMVSFTLIDTYEEHTNQLAIQVAKMAIKNGLTTLAIVDFRSGKIKLSKKKIVQFIAQIKKTFHVTFLTTIDFHQSIKKGRGQKERGFNSYKIISDLIDLIFNSESKIIDLELKKLWHKNKLVLTCYGSSNSRFRAADATRQALQNIRSLEFSSCVAKIVGDANVKTIESNNALSILKEAIDGKRPIIYDIKRDYSCEGFKILLFFSGLVLNRLPDFRENPLRTLYNLEPESSMEEPLGFDLDLPILE